MLSVQQFPSFHWLSANPQFEDVFRGTELDCNSQTCGIILIILSLTEVLRILTKEVQITFSHAGIIIISISTLMAIKTCLNFY